MLIDVVLLLLHPQMQFYKELLRNKISTSLTCSTEHIPRDDDNNVFQSSNIKLSTLNSTSNIALDGNWVSQYKRFKWTLNPSLQPPCAQDLLLTLWLDDRLNSTEFLQTPQISHQS